MRVSVIKQPGVVWRDYIEQNPFACGSHDPRWGSVLEQVYGHRPIYLQAEESGKVQGVLPLMMMSSLLFGRLAVSMPYLNHGGICADSVQARDALFEKAVEMVREFKARWMELRHEPSLDWPLAVRRHKVSMRLTLPRDPEDLFRSFPAKLRSQVRRAEKEGMAVQYGGADEVSAFYHVFSRNMRDLGTPTYPVRFFEKVMAVFSETTRIITVCEHSRPVASALVIGFKDRLEIPWASSIREYNRFGANMLLYWSVLEYACKSGYRIFDFGRSTPGSGTYKFKEQWGAQPVSLHWYYWLAEGEKLPDISPQNPRYKLAVRLWKHLPLKVARWLGPMVSRNLP